VRVRDWRVHAGLLFVQVTFGAFHVVGKGILAHLQPLAVAGARVAFATPLLFLLAHRVERVRPARRHLPRLALLGLLGVFANQVFYILGLQHTTASNAGILMPSIPVFTVAAAAALGVDRLTLRRTLAVLCAVGGAIVLLGPGGANLAGGTTLGNALILANCLSFALFLVLQRPLLEELPPLTVVAWAFLFGGAGVLVISLPDMLSVPFATVPPATWVGLAYLILIPTAVNYAINTWAIRRSSPGLVATYTTLQPVVATLLGVAFLAESPGWRDLIGFALIIAGLVGVGRRRSPAAGRS